MKNLFKPFVCLLIVALSLVLCFPVGASPSSTPESKNSVVAMATGNAQATKASVQGNLEVDFNDKTAVSAVTGNFFTDNWGALTLGLLTFLETIVRITPSEKDNSILKVLVTIFNALVPNRRKGGGTF